MELRVESASACEKVQKKVNDKLTMVEQKITGLESLKKVLNELIECCNRRQPTEECPILRAMEEERGKAMSEKERIINGNDAGHLLKISRICREVSIKDLCEECERTSLYPEENCGCPTTVVICEDAPQEVERSSKTRLPEAGL